MKRPGILRTLGGMAAAKVRGSLPVLEEHLPIVLVRNCGKLSVSPICLKLRSACGKMRLKSMKTVILKRILICVQGQNGEVYIYGVVPIPY